jgi:enoyl-[acyl-carrier protein] reductase I
MGFLNNKKALITGVISNRSIAYGIAQALAEQGAELAFTYQNEKLRPRVAKLVAPWGAEERLFPCDVSSDEDIKNVFTELEKHWDGLDILIHSIAYAPGDQLKGDYVYCVTREGFQMAHEISSYSLAALAQAAKPMLVRNKGAIATMTYLGGERAVHNYNVMGVAKASLEANVKYLAYSMGPHGVRVNAVSSGPIRTLAASGIKDFRKMEDYNEQVSPLRSNVTPKQVGDTAAFLCSDLASGITGETVHVDSGYHIVGVPPGVE